METTTQPREVNYKFWKDSKMMGMILLIVTVAIQMFAYLDVPVLSTINAYTVGMLFGACNPFFYIYVVYISLIMIFKDSIKLPGWVKLTKTSYWFVAVSVMFIVSSSGHYQTETHSWTGIGGKTFDAMPKWFSEFTSKSAWYPSSAWGGVVGAFLYSLFGSMVSGIGSLVVAIVLLVVSISILVTGTSIGLYKGMIKKRNMDLAKKEIKADEEVSYDNISEVEKISEANELPFDDPFPFEDPFEE